MVGKYTGLTDAYLSVIKGLQHSAYYVGKKLIIDWVNSSHLEPAKKEKNPAKYEEAWKLIKSAHGILVPGGFGNRGTEGKIIAANYARTNKIPYFGICLGLQIAVIEYARNVLGWTDATSEEFEVESEHQVVVFMPEISKSVMGGTMRLGARQTIINDKSKIASVLYKRLWNVEGKVNERHRHRYEVNPAYVEALSKAGLKFVGQDESGVRQEILELDDHPFYLGVQYHPEMKTRPLNPSPPFVGFVLAAAKEFDSWANNEKWERCVSPS
eukprot:TRINITY_DN2908_c0_g1_i3.p2 TRINITY_DN2908_c0_g1~~TRINITY_DN2908_c0_g1_i3.p2  ORF type:complete len:270 (+),score=61.98 TRINITY_DN2908_c0_g1_i3:1007-1816(+)